MLSLFLRNVRTILIIIVGRHFTIINSVIISVWLQFSSEENQHRNIAMFKVCDPRRRLSKVLAVYASVMESKTTEIVSTFAR